MTRKSKREIERTVEDLVDDGDTADTVEGVTAEWVKYQTGDGEALPDDALTAYEVIDASGEQVETMYRLKDGGTHRWPQPEMKTE